MKLKKLLLMAMAMIMTSGCGTPKQEIVEIDIEASTWEEVVEASKDTTVTYYGWGGDEKVNKYIDESVAPKVKEQYNIELKRVGMDIADILSKLLTEKEVGAKGTMDIVWLNGENFYTAKNNGLLYGEIVDKLPNNKYLDMNTEINTVDFGVATEGMEVPLGKAQFMLFGDMEKVDTLPTNPDTLLEWAKNNPGKITYPSAYDFTGSAFVRTIIFQLVDETLLMKEGLSKEEVFEIIEPGLQYLKELKPYLWREGTTYPATYAQLSNMYADGEVDFCMTYTANGMAHMIEQGIYPKATQAFILDKGTLTNTHFLTIPTNATNKAGALVVMNALLTPELQAIKMDPKGWGDLTSLDMTKLGEEEKRVFETVQKGKGTLGVEETLGKEIAEPHASYIEVINSLWEEHVLR
ncbi:MAG: ABC transporter substrate-binding protein [Cellulosilyticaceae bacterium]